MANEEKVLNMVLQKKYAMQIVKGEKVREYRAFCDHWAIRLCTFDDPDDKYLATGIKHFDRVHFYPYNNKWFVDCEIKTIALINVDQAFLDEFGHEVEAELGSDIFVIRLGKVIGQNLVSADEVGES